MIVVVAVVAMVVLMLAVVVTPFVRYCRHRFEPVELVVPRRGVVRVIFAKKGREAPGVGLCPYIFGVVYLGYQHFFSP